ncbi:CmpA/NrtA family ABC transporter substrate-binding protein [uncultured Cohaesibacter sp.]|uniref:CmpA/NrtA family ABC transporter substrate-binding protein n=1 Tax=uncultured Cohaesibacter sp. TaxID=1002546 RepID=UPI0029C97710|nr:CmpA/NrtA family ABC transporter substrate-binding protein [uncultured Cohaesibacter sp.]
MTAAKDQVIAGFIPLLDSAVLVAAAHRGFAEAEGIDLQLVRETSWANIRDRIFVGHFDVAHMLAPMPIASSLKITSLAVPTRAMMGLGTGGNAITLSMDLARTLEGHGWSGDLDPMSSARALAVAVKERAGRGNDPLRFGVVHPFSGHAYELRYWMAAVGVDPDKDVIIRVLPPALMPDALASGQIDGYCVGEPWNVAGVSRGIGRIVTCKQAIWPNSPDKVLGVTDGWAIANRDKLDALMRALSVAADWCAMPENADDLAGLLSGNEFLDCPKEFCLPALTKRLPLGTGAEIEIPGFITFGGGEFAAPRIDYGLWFYSQMVRWGQALYTESDLAVVTRVFDDTYYRRALGLPLDRQTDITSSPVALFDGLAFSAPDVAGYVSQFPVKA